MIPEHLKSSVRRLRKTDAEFAALFMPRPMPTKPRLSDPDNNPTIQLKRDQGLFDDPVERTSPTAAQIYWGEIERLFGSNGA